MKRRTPAIIAAMVIAATGITAIVVGAAPATAAATTTVAFRDDFTGTGLPDPTKWIVDTGIGYPKGPQGGFGTDAIETETNNPANVHQANGHLYITPIRAADGTWTSGRIETPGEYKPDAGSTMRIESSLALPDVHGAQAAGYWPAFWALGATDRTNRWDWPASGEFDIAETVNGVPKNWATLHCGFPAQWGGPCGEPSGISNGGVAAASDVWGQSHLYAFEWDRTRGAGNDQLRWYVDGVVVHSVDETDPRMATVWDAMTSHAGYFIILNAAIGGQFPAALGGGPTGATVSGVPMVVDYVQVSYTAGGAVPTTTPTTTAPTTATTPPTTTAGTTTPTTTTAPTCGPVTSTTAAPTSSATPGGPTNLHVVTSTASTITLGWTGTGTFDILRSGVRIATVTGSTFTDIGLFKATPYIYSVRGNGVTTPQITATIA